MIAYLFKKTLILNHSLRKEIAFLNYARGEKDLAKFSWMVRRDFDALNLLARAFFPHSTNCLFSGLHLSFLNFLIVAFAVFSHIHGMTGRLSTVQLTGVLLFLFHMTPF